MDDQTLQRQLRHLWEHNLDAPMDQRDRRLSMARKLAAAAAVVVIAVGGALLVLRDDAPGETGVATDLTETPDSTEEGSVEFPDRFEVETPVNGGQFDVTLVDGTQRTVVLTEGPFDTATVRVALWFENPSRSYIPVYGSGPEELADALCQNERAASEQCLTQPLSEGDPRIAIVGPDGRLFHVFGETQPAGSYSWQVVGTDTTTIEAQYEDIEVQLTDTAWLTFDSVPDGLDLTGVEYQITLHDAGTGDATEVVLSVGCDDQITESVRRYLLNRNVPGDVGDYECVDGHRISGDGASAVARIDPEPVPADIPNPAPEILTGRPGDSAKDIAERVMDEFLGAPAVTMAVDQPNPRLELVTLETFDGGTVEATIVTAADGTKTLQELASPGFAIRESNGALIETPTPGRLLIRGYDGQLTQPGELMIADQPIDSPGTSGPFSLVESSWLQMQLDPADGASLYYLAPR